MKPNDVYVGQTVWACLNGKVVEAQVKVVDRGGFVHNPCTISANIDGDISDIDVRYDVLFPANRDALLRIAIDKTRLLHLEEAKQENGDKTLQLQIQRVTNRHQEAQKKRAAKIEELKAVLDWVELELATGKIDQA